MSNSSFAECLLSLFTKPDRAASMAGDLTEESGSRGAVWFWLHVLRTCGALFVRDIGAAPGLVIGLFLLGAVMLQLALSVISPALMQMFGWNPAAPDLRVWSLGNVLWGRIAAPFLVGIFLARLSPLREMAACVALAVAMAALFLGSASLTPLALSFVGLNLITLIPLLSGAAVVRLRRLRVVH